MNDFDMSLNMSFTPVLKDAFAFLEKKKTVSAAAFQEMLEPVKNNLYNFILKSLNFSEDAHDVFQETALRAFKYISGFKENYSFKTWIFAIAQNEIRGYYRKNRGKTGHTALDNPLDENEGGGSPDDHDAATKALVKTIYEIAAELTPQQRNIFFLFYDERFSIKEIGRITGLKEGNIKFILNRSREIIKERFGVTSRNSGAKLAVNAGRQPGFAGADAPQERYDG